MNQFPIYIVSKGRYETCLTMKALERMGIPYNVIVEPQEVELYKKACKWNIIELDMSYKDKYETCDNLWTTKSTGSGPARNFAGDHSRKLWYTHHWVMDDNIRWFYRLHNNTKVLVEDDSFFEIMEDFVLKYENIGMAGPQYRMFAPQSIKLQPLSLNTRIFSCNLIRNDVPFRWRGRFNEDIILSLDMLKAWWATLLFNALLQEKLATQSVKGGNTAELYKKGTLEKSLMLVRVHPECTKVKFKYWRWHHEADFSRFKKIPLIRNEKWQQKKDYGLKLVKIK